MRPASRRCVAPPSASASTDISLNARGRGRGRGPRAAGGADGVRIGRVYTMVYAVDAHAISVTAANHSLIGAEGKSVYHSSSSSCDSLQSAGRMPFFSHFAYSASRPKRRSLHRIAKHNFKKFSRTCFPEASFNLAPFR